MEKGKFTPDSEAFKEFWEGHSFGDSCPIEEVKGSNIKATIGCLLVVPMVVDVVLEQSREARQRREAFDKLRSFLPIKRGSPIKTFAKGEKFELDKYPKGTILYFSYDAQYPDIDNHPFRHEYWGIISQTRIGGKVMDVVYGFTEIDLMPHKLLHSGFRTTEGMTIGKIEHNKFDGSSISFALNQSLRRYNSLEVWKFGLEARERESIPEQILRKLAPRVNH